MIKAKAFTLFSGTEDNFWFNISTLIAQNGGFEQRGCFILSYSRDVEYLKNKNYRENNQEKIKSGKKKYYSKNRKRLIKKYIDQRQILYKLHPEIRAARDAKRRQLGFIFLNDRFDGADGHHIDKRHIVFIPKELHHSVYHNIWTGRGMNEINAEVLKWSARI